MGFRYRYPATPDAIAGAQRAAMAAAAAAEHGGRSALHAEDRAHSNAGARSDEHGQPGSPPGLNGARFLGVVPLFPSDISLQKRESEG